MLELNLFDSNFVGQSCSVATLEPRLMRYVRGRMEWPGVTVFTDRWMYDPVVDDVQSRFKIGWLHEGRCLHGENYERIGEVAHKFNAIMTHDSALLSCGADSNKAFFLKTIRGGSWVPLDAWGMYPKSRNVSMIFSEKTQLEGHKLRHSIASAGLPIDLFGPAYTPIGYDKSIAYRDYRFAVVVEACRDDNFFSEHLIDALAFGCVPIYWGCENIGEWFARRGFLVFDQVSDLSTLLYLLNAGYETAYAQLAPIVERNQQTARAYAITEDWQIQNCLRPFVEAL